MSTDNPTTLPQFRQVPASHAWAWTVRGFQLFRANPAMWIILWVIYLAIILPISMIPLIGSVITTLLAPVFAAGMMWGCQAVAQQQDLEINHLFAGFKKNTSQLISVGGIYMASLLAVAVMVVLSMDSATIAAIKLEQGLTTEQADAMLPPLFFAMLCIVPILMAYWYAPLLVGLNNLTAGQALKLSFTVCLKNLLPFFVYGVIFTLMLLVAIIPFGLGLLVAVPVMMTSLYASYEDVFVHTTAN
ncbi:hypothetical protein MCETALH18_01443 [Methylophilaceae bacterium]|jgi:uncharacterized membrane protein